MPVNLATPPPESTQVLQDTLQRWVNQPSLAPQSSNIGISFATDAGVQVQLPHPVYNLSLADLVAGKTLTAATLVSWRYLLNDSETTAMAEVSPSAAGQASALTMINRGPFVASLVQAVDAAGANTAFNTGTYEVAVLSIPALYVMALWLRSATPGGGTLIPLSPAPTQLTAGQSYTEPAFLLALAPLAQQKSSTGGSALA
jgi:hypothetical protein